MEGVGRPAPTPFLSSLRNLIRRRFVPAAGCPPESLRRELDLFTYACPYRELFLKGS